MLMSMWFFEDDQVRIGRLVVGPLDNNVFIVADPHGEAAVIDGWCRGELRLCVSDAILSEVQATLSRLPVRSDRKVALLNRLHDSEFTNRIAVPPDSGFRCADPSDDKFLHLAAAAGADWTNTPGFNLMLTTAIQVERQADRGLFGGTVNRGDPCHGGLHQQ